MTDYKIQLNEIEKSVYSFLKPQGFKKKGRTFNRQTEKGLYQVINFQSGQFPIGGNYVIPGIRESFYGTFTINLGVCIEEIYNLAYPGKPKTFYREYNCHLRLRLSKLIRGDDHWWSIGLNNEKISEEIIEGLNSKGLSWLDKFSSREKIIRNWGDDTYASLRAKLDVALIVLFSDKEKGTTLLTEYFNGIEPQQKGHREYVLELASKFGVKINQPFC